MSDRDGMPDPSSSAEDTELSGRLRDLGRRLGEHRDDPGEDVPEDSAPRNPSVAMAMRAASDFVAGVIVEHFLSKWRGLTRYRCHRTPLPVTDHSRFFSGLAPISRARACVLGIGGSAVSQGKHGGSSRTRTLA